jgi:hypothetical protein
MTDTRTENLRVPPKASLVERLRAGNGSSPDHMLLLEAANRIVQQEIENLKLRNIKDDWETAWEPRRQEIIRYRAALHEICSLACHEPMSAELAGKALSGIDL